jgi:phosphatidate cytidylyltransferase
MKKRIITGICVSVFWLTLLLWAPTWCLFPVLLVAMLACCHEYCAMLKRAGMEVSQKFLMITGVLWLTACFGKTYMLFAIFLVPGLFSLFLRVLFDPKIKKPFEMLGTTTLGFFYIPFMLGFFILLAQWGTSDWTAFVIGREGIFLALFVALVTKAGDSGALAAGLKFGKHKMFPRISPKKTWEGLAGGLALSGVLGVGFVWLAQNVFPEQHFATLRQFSLLEAAIVSVVLSGIGVIGDLIESQLKRATNTKDSSGILPGMGGLLDNFDSLLFTPAAFYFYLLFMYG